ncbi:hypothetical protein [Kineococcus glutinatus]|uniref:hypothetical protein n=1 Tax=Kineococcus glutinatus TaxID=1070872 RepID=UPI0031E74E2D
MNAERTGTDREGSEEDFDRGSSHFRDRIGAAPGPPPEDLAGYRVEPVAEPVAPPGAGQR